MSGYLSTANIKLELPGVAFITGGASGLGRGAALAFADLGARIAIADINEKGSQELAELINSRYPDAALAVRCDVSDEESIKSAVAETVSKYGRIDYAINSAGIVVGGKAVVPIKDFEIADYERIQTIDARGIFLCMKYQLRQMSKQEIPNRRRASRGVIVNLASRASLEGVPRFGAYCSAKHAVLGMTRVAAVENAKDKIRVIAMCPGLIRTPGHVEAAKEVDDMLLAKVPMGQFGIPEDITDGLVFVCSDGASYMTGCTFEIDGGCAAI